MPRHYLFLRHCFSPPDADAAADADMLPRDFSAIRLDYFASLFRHDVISPPRLPDA